MSMSSTALRAKARAEAAAAIKKAEMHKKRSLAESQSALNIQREEFALAKRKLEEQARLEALRLEDDAAVAVAGPEKSWSRAFATPTFKTQPKGSKKFGSN